MKRIKNKILKKLLDKNKPILVAEISANHNGSLSRAKKLIDCAKKILHATKGINSHIVSLSPIKSAAIDQPHAPIISCLNNRCDTGIPSACFSAQPKQTQDQESTHDPIPLK